MHYLLLSCITHVTVTLRLGFSQILHKGRYFTDRLNAVLMSIWHVHKEYTNSANMMLKPYANEPFVCGSTHHASHGRDMI